MSMLSNMITIIEDNWLLLLIGQYPNGPLGGIASTLILSVLGIVLAFPLSVLIALARLSQFSAVWPPSVGSSASMGVPSSRSFSMILRTHSGVMGSM